MMKKILCGILMMLILLACTSAVAEDKPVTREELEELVARLTEMARTQPILNDPAGEEARSEDGYAFQYEFGVLYTDSTEITEKTEANAITILDTDVPAIRGIAIDWDVNRVMEAIPCGNEEMYGSRNRALLYLKGSLEEGFSYGLVERDGQRIQAMEYGVADPVGGTRLSVTFEISGDGVSAIGLFGLREKQDQEALKEFYTELQQLTRTFAYYRVPQSRDGSRLAMFEEADLDFTSLSYQTAVPEIFDDNVEDVLIDNEDGTWLRVVDGDGFSAVFTCNSKGENARLISYTILGPELEGPRFVQLGDLFHEDFNRFRHGEGELDESGTTEVLYGTPGTAPYGLAEYNGDEMTLRYVTETTSGEQVELLLRYQETILSEIILHTL